MPKTPQGGPADGAEHGADHGGQPDGPDSTGGLDGAAPETRGRAVGERKKKYLVAPRQP